MYAWGLSTKYYDVDLEVHVLPSSHFSAPSASTSDALDGAEAVVLLLDATNTPAWTTELAAAWKELLLEKEPTTGLCVINKADLATASDAAAYAGWVEGLLAWSLDAGVELVEAAASGASFTPAREEEDERSATGVARVHEALQSTMWNGMRRRGGGGGGGGAGGGLMALAMSGGVGAGAGGLGGAGRWGASKGDGSDDEAAGGAAAASGGTKAGEAAAAASHRSVEAGGVASATASGVAPAQPATASSGAASDAVAPTVAVSGPAEPPAPGGGGLSDMAALLSAALAADKEEGGGGSGVDEKELETLFAGIKAARDAAKTGAVTDAQRRETAAKMAMQLLSLMGGLRDDDEDSDEE